MLSEDFGIVFYSKGLEAPLQRDTFAGRNVTNIFEKTKNSFSHAENCVIIGLYAKGEEYALLQNMYLFIINIKWRAKNE